jgi:hypothetical protein
MAPLSARVNKKMYKKTIDAAYIMWLDNMVFYLKGVKNGYRTCRRQMCKHSPNLRAKGVFAKIRQARRPNNDNANPVYD